MGRGLGHAHPSGPAGDVFRSPPFVCMLDSPVRWISLVFLHCVCVRVSPSRLSRCTQPGRFSAASLSLPAVAIASRFKFLSIRFWFSRFHLLLRNGPRCRRGRARLAASRSRLSHVALPLLISTTCNLSLYQLSLFFGLSCCRHLFIHGLRYLQFTDGTPDHRHRKSCFFCVPTDVLGSGLPLSSANPSQRSGKSRKSPFAGDSSISHRRGCMYPYERYLAQDEAFSGERHHVRFFPEQASGDRNGNPLLGILAESQGDRAAIYSQTYRLSIETAIPFREHWSKLGARSLTSGILTCASTWPSR